MVHSECTRVLLELELLVVEAVDVRAQVARRQALVLVSIVVLDVVRIIAMHGRDAAGEPLVGLVAAIQRYDAVAKHSPANRDRVVVALALFARHR